MKLEKTLNNHGKSLNYKTTSSRKLAVGHLSGYWWFQVLIISNACMVYKHAVVAAFHIYAQQGKVAV